MRSLTGRLVATAVAMVALISLLLVALTTVAMWNYLTARQDDQLRSTPVNFSPRTPRDQPPERDDRHEHDGDFDQFGQGPGTLQALLDDSPAGNVIVTDGPAGTRALSAEDLAVLAALPADGQVHSADLPDAGDYRVITGQSRLGTTVTGLPSAEVNHTVVGLLWRGLILAAFGVLVALGVALALVRRQLRPLREMAATAHEVAELPLSTGEINLSARVPAHLTDERTEVGQVGAALNTMLAHVESSLEFRHRSEQQVRQFVADASHELRTPLATIKGYTELARKRPDDRANVATALDKVGAESERMTTLVEDLLLLARLDSGRPLDSSTVDLTRLLIEAVSDARVVSPEHQWRLDLPEQALEVTGDELRLHQVVTNLLTNARRYTPAGTTVTVTARPGRLTVHDDGPGFPPDLVSTAFERFARGDSARTRVGDGGIGLGLSLVEAIVTAHGGTVSLTSVPGDTTIEVNLPA